MPNPFQIRKEPRRARLGIADRWVDRGRLTLAKTRLVGHRALRSSPSDLHFMQHRLDFRDRRVSDDKISQRTPAIERKMFVPRCAPGANNLSPHRSRISRSVAVASQQLCDRQQYEGFPYHPTDAACALEMGQRSGGIAILQAGKPLQIERVQLSLFLDRNGPKILQDARQRIGKRTQCFRQVARPRQPEPGSGSGFRSLLQMIGDMHRNKARQLSPRYAEADQ